MDQVNSGGCDYQPLPDLMPGQELQPNPVTIDTPGVEVNYYDACFVKARAKGEPTFTLRGQDHTAATCVRFWALLQIHVRVDCSNGFTIEESIRRVERLISSRLGLPDELMASYIKEITKLDGAMVRSMELQQWPHKKLAD